MKDTILQLLALPDRLFSEGQAMLFGFILPFIVGWLVWEWNRKR